MDFRYVFDEEIYSVEEGLQKLNLEAGKFNYRYIRGSSDKTKGWFYLICRCRFKNPDEDDDETAEKKNVYNENKDINNENKQCKIFCESYYGFKIQSGGSYKLNGFKLIHNHEGKDNSDMSEAMLQDLFYIPKWISIVDIVDFFEAKYGIKKLNYSKVYRHIRKLKPRLGEDDCQYFYDYLIGRNFDVKKDTISDKLCKILFSSAVMKKNYDIFGDIVLIDTTYQTNVYKAPLVVFTGISCDGKNVLFALALLNNETDDSYDWIIQNFLSIHNNKRPQVCVTDGDLSLCKSVKKWFNTSTHYICQWHLDKNLRRHFSYLKKKNTEKYDQILALPYIKKREDFDAKVNALEQFFSSNILYEQSLLYLRELCSFKLKWADSYKELIFTGGTHTTSRAEAMNRVIKQYVGKTSELSAMIEMIETLDKAYAFEDPLEHVTRTAKNQYQLDLTMLNIKVELGGIIYSKHYAEYLQHSYYTIRLPPDNQNELTEPTTFEVYRDTKTEIKLEEIEVIKLENENSEENKHSKRFVTMSKNKMSCSCGLFLIEGIICRHMFAVSKVSQTKDLSEYLHSRWVSKNFKPQLMHNISQQQIRDIQKKESERVKESEKEMNEHLEFVKVLIAARKGKEKRIKRNSNTEEEKDEEEEEEEKNEALDKEEEDRVSQKNAGKKQEDSGEKERKNLRNFDQVKTKGKTAKKGRKNSKSIETVKKELDVKDKKVKKSGQGK